MLRIEGLDCGYGLFQAVHALDLEVRQGSICALLGANGAGKSSTLMCVAGHVTRFGGRISLDGVDISDLPAKDRVKRGIAISPEGRRLFPDLSVAENLAVGGLTRPKSELPEARDRVMEYFPRLGERIHQPAGKLSGGEQQMLAIGRALMSDPKVLMIDELSLGLMPKVVDICYEVLTNLVSSAGLSVLLVEQNTKKALAAAGFVCVLESGRVVWSGDGHRARDNQAEVEAAVLGQDARHIARDS